MDEQLNLGDLSDETQRFFAKQLLDIRRSFTASVEPLYKLYNDQFSNFDRAYGDLLKLIATLSFGLAGTWLPIIKLQNSGLLAGVWDLRGIASLVVSGFISISWLLAKNTSLVTIALDKNRMIKTIETEVLKLPEMNKVITSRVELDAWKSAVLPYEKRLRDITMSNTSKNLTRSYEISGLVSIGMLFFGVSCLAYSLFTKLY